MKPQSEFTKNIVSLLTGRGGMMLAQFLNGIVLARALGPEGRGVYTALLVIPQLLLTISELGIRQSATYLIGRGEYSDRDIAGALSSLFIVSSSAGMVICFLIYQFQGNRDFTLALQILGIGVIPILVWRSYAQGFLAGKQRLKEFAQLNWMPYAVQLVISVILVWVLDFGVAGAVFAMLVGALPTTIYAAKLVSEHTSIRPCANFEVIRNMLKSGLAYAASLFIIMLSYRVNILMLERWSTNLEVGYFSLCLTFTEIIWQIPAALGIAVFANSAGARNAREASARAAKVVRLVMLACVAIGILVVCAMPLVVPVVYGREFEPSIAIFDLMLPGVILIVLFKVLNMDIAGKGRPWMSLYAVVPGMICNILFGAMLIPEHHGRGAAIASTCGYSLTALIYILLFCRTTGLRLSEVLWYQANDLQEIERMFRRILTFRRRV